MAHRGLRRFRADIILGKLVTKAVLERDLIQDGDRVLLALSGGKDSSALAWALSAWRPAFKRKFDLRAVHIASEFSPPLPQELLAALEEWGIKPISIEIPILGRLKDGKKMNCYWCSTQRRTELIKYAMENGYTSLALGHHMDDILETFLMNLCESGSLQTMPASMQYDKYPLRLIRPLVYVEERQIVDFIESMNLGASTCSCGYGEKSKRILARKRLQALSGGSSAVKRRILSASYELEESDLAPSSPSSKYTLE